MSRFVKEPFEGDKTVKIFFGLWFAVSALASLALTCAIIYGIVQLVQWITTK